MEEFDLKNTESIHIPFHLLSCHLEKFLSMGVVGAEMVIRSG